MTTPADDQSIPRPAIAGAAERKLLHLVDQAVAREQSNETWLLAQLPAVEHARARRLLAAASRSAADGVHLRARFFEVKHPN